MQLHQREREDNILEAAKLLNIPTGGFSFQLNGPGQAARVSSEQ